MQSESSRNYVRESTSSSRWKQFFPLTNPRAGASLSGPEPELRVVETERTGVKHTLATVGIGTSLVKNTSQIPATSFHQMKSVCWK